MWLLKGGWETTQTYRIIVENQSKNVRAECRDIIFKWALDRWKYVVGRTPQDFKMTRFDTNGDDKFEFTIKVFNYTHQHMHVYIYIYIYIYRLIDR